MFEFIEGHFISRDPDGRMILYNERNGVGYQIYTLTRDWQNMAGSDELRVFIRAKFSDSEGYTLFGFEDPLDRRAFDVLCKAQGVGGKTAMSILNSLTLADLATATPATFKAVKGVGPKMALKIIPELDVLSDLVASGSKAIDGPADEAVMALVSLGYPRDKALVAVRHALEQDAMAESATLLRIATGILHR